MPKDLLEKFDKEFENKAKEWTSAQNGACACLGNCDKCGFHRCHGCLCSFKSLAHSHIEAAYRAGKLENIRCAGCGKCLSRPGIITGEMCVAEYDCECHHPFTHQSNLERLKYEDKVPKV